MNLTNVIKKPIVTEKFSSLEEKGRTYGFLVDVKSNKSHIRDAIEKFFNVKVSKVRTSVLPGRLKRVGRFQTKTNKSKRAYVTLAEGQKIELLKGI